MANIRINQLPEDLTPIDTDVVAVDSSLGGTTRRVPIPNLGDLVRPLASQPEAEAGLNNTKTMTPLRVKQGAAAEINATTPNMRKLGAVPGGSTAVNDAAFDAAEASSYEAIYLPPGRYPTSKGSYDVAAKRYYGEGQIVLGGYGQARQRSYITSPQPVASTDRTQIFDGGFNKAHSTSYSFVGSGANPAVLPDEYTNFIEWSANVHIHDYTAGFNTDTADHAGGRSGGFKDWTGLYHGGGGDLTKDSLYGSVYATRSGATHWFATPALAVQNGGFGVEPGTGCAYLQFSEFIFSDSGNDISAIAHVMNFVRTNRTRAIEQVWGYLRPQSSGSEPVDFVLAPSGKWGVVIDTTAADLGTNQAWAVVAGGHRIYWDAVATPDSEGGAFYSQDLGATYTFYGFGSLINVVDGVPVSQFGSTQVIITKPLIVTPGDTSPTLPNGGITFIMPDDNTLRWVAKTPGGVTKTGDLPIT